MRSMIGLSSGRTMLVPPRRKPSCTLRDSRAGLTEQFEPQLREPLSHLLDQLGWQAVRRELGKASCRHNGLKEQAQGPGCAA
jgi:hypothetical protein